MPNRRAKSAVLLAGLAGTGALLLTACTSSGGVTPGAGPTGVTASKSATGAAAGNGSAAKGGTSTSAPSGSGSAAPSGSGAGTNRALPVPSLRSKPNAHGLPCNAQGLVVHLAQASGAVHGYLAKPGNSGATVIALKSRTATANGARAARYSATHLTAGMASAGGCATTGALGSVAHQTSAYLLSLGGLLERGKATAAQVAAAEALIADVTSQAQRTGIKIVDQVPTASLLLQQH